MHPIRITSAAAAFSVGLALLAARPGASPSVPDLPSDARSQIQSFLERYAPLAPDRRISWQLDAADPSLGYGLLKYDATSSERSFDRAGALLISRDSRWVFDGHVLNLPASLADPRDPKTAQGLSRYLSGKVGAPVEVTWDVRPGPEPGYPARIRQQTPLGPVVTGGALAKDGRWLFVGSFYPLQRDPREERLRRIGLAGRYTEGPAGAPVTLVELFDYQCPSCAELESVIRAVLSRYPGSIRLVPVDLPQWRSHDWAAAAAEAGLCVEAVAPAAFPAYRRAVYDRQGAITAQNVDALLRPVLEGLEIPWAGFAQCRQGGKGRARILSDLGTASTMGIEATPVVLLNGELLEGKIDRVLDGELERILAGGKRARSGATGHR